ncbi:glycosyltransferase [uncultured Maribacter sp.]|uniref:glycosyltransferase n=1 Tax=uncultured Maribacter sp. TaxID=431308 RepID=UPI00262148BE|nr:glycosyltransferase [uncultured Maribacter sp.]
MNKIVIGIPTFKRIVLLEKLIKSIYASKLDYNLVCGIDIVVVDNDIEKSAKPIINKLSTYAPKSFKIYYFNEPTKGLSYVRNEILKQAFKFNSKFIVCVDDDEHVVAEWLIELTKTIIHNKGDFAIGPVLPEFVNQPPLYISKWFYRKNHDNNKQLYDFFGGGNLIMKTEFLKKNNLSYDNRFNTTGGEDSYFGLEALKKDAKVFWAKKALAYETIGNDRANIYWLFKRAFRGGNTYTYILIVERMYFLLLKKIIINIFRICIGIPLLLLLLFPIKNKYHVLFKFIATSLGSFAAILKIKFHEYGPLKKSNPKCKNTH